MLRTILSFSALTLGASLSFVAQAATTVKQGEESQISHKAEGIQVAQDGDYQVFYDGKGNRVIVDGYTGKVIAIQPPQTRFDRRALRLENRQRRVERAPDDERYYLDDPEDMARFRRRQMEDQRAYQYPEDDGGYYDGYPPQGGMADTFPPAPGSRDRYGDPLPANPEGIPAPQPVERQPLEASIDPAQPTSPDASIAPDQPATGGKSAVNPSLSLGAREDVAALQVLLDRAGASPGAVDGRFGSNMDKAITAYREITGTNLKSTDTAAIKEELEKSGGPAFATYSITAEDAAGPYVASIPEDYSQKATLERMSFTSVTEALAERFHMDEAYLKAINPGVNFNRPGTLVKVVNFGKLAQTPVTHIIADKGRKQVRAYDASGKLVAAYPATIGSSDTPSPTGTHAVSRVAFDPNYTYNPKINFKQGANDKVLTIPPGPNGPVGSIWIALDKPTYGIHGTPEPSKIGKTESHGCVRLTNWDAAELARLVKPGVPVDFVE
ncbi:L,D-transpeptidase family protein [Mesorhizobium retamae]|uniref:L,D-transpeptidase family protein n=1 Tax=Mesorhizobium retamae TaxID=2912854 RepID=A0ABS9QB40_9HYPH|nr:L,D-transpeptidase [Mesorhizobium sp. IRAMC:0171]MCG7504637.1 L,D-transpeptidase family protein [Mesorhizobium sp. IRAMC:0171]